MSFHHSPDIYKVPRESVNVEALAQEITRCMQIATEDTEYLSFHAAERDNILEELYKDPRVKPHSSLGQLVPIGSDPDEYLVPAKAELERLTPPKTLQDRVMRVHLATAITMVIQRYKVAFALQDYDDLDHKVHTRTWEILSHWLNTEFPRLFPDRSKRTARTPSIPQWPVREHVPAPAPTPTSIPTPTHRSGESVSYGEIEEFLSNPSTLVGKQFVHSPPQDQDQDDRGAWRVISCSVRKRDEGVECEYEVVLEAFGADPFPMGEEEVRHFLKYSTFAV